MRVDKTFAPKTICIETKEDEQFINNIIAYAQEYLYSKNRWIGRPREMDREMNEKINFFRRLLA